MRTFKIVGWVMLAGIVVMTGCANKQKDQLALLTEENENLRAQLADRNAALDANHMDKTAAPRDLGSAGTPASSDGVTWSKSAGEVRATVNSDVLFDSGKTTLKASAKKSLDSVMSVLSSQYSGWMIRVEGHTDSDPIKKSGYKSNYHLGFERALAVREYLISKGVPQNRIALASFGPDQPAGSKAQSRRVAIVAYQP